ncbi:MAG TPA: transglycosylase SLT domain-containing protein [Xanthobacteraceae bacterium]|nr:transglycosylase SLT domain-containing protein [Xanthobacteraceae bacterium]
MALTDKLIAARLGQAEALLAECRQELECRAQPPAKAPLCWGAKVSDEFRKRVRWIAETLQLDANDLMACMAWESGRSFSPSKRNLAGSGATGLIQFMPSTARSLGTTTDALAGMTAEDQLNFVYKYFRPWKGRLPSLSDVYMAILWPSAVGKGDDYALFTGGVAYRQNVGLDLNKDGKVTKAECSAKLYAIRAEGLRPENLA